MDRRVTLTLWNAAINCVAAGADTQDPLPPLLPLPRRTCQAGLRPVRRTPAGCCRDPGGPHADGGPRPLHAGSGPAAEAKHFFLIHV